MFQTLRFIKACSGVKTTAPEARLCRACVRTDPQRSNEASPIEPAARMEKNEPKCINFMSKD